MEWGNAMLTVRGRHSSLTGRVWSLADKIRTRVQKKGRRPEGTPSRGGRVESGQAAFLAPFADSETVWADSDTVWSNHFVSWAWCSEENLIRSCERWVARSANCVESSILRAVRSFRSRTVLASCICFSEYSRTSPAKAYCWRAMRSKPLSESSLNLMAGAIAFLPASRKALKSKVGWVISGILEINGDRTAMGHCSGVYIALQQDLAPASDCRAYSSN